MPVDYSHGKIYKLVSNQTDAIYIGSTASALHQRLYQHKIASNKCFSKQLTQYDDCRIILIEDYACNNKRELTAREYYQIQKHLQEGAALVNKSMTSGIAPNQTYKEYMAEYKPKYYAENKEKIAEKCKAYREANKEKCDARSKAYRETHKEQKAATDKAYREKMGDALKQKKKAYYEANKETVAEKAKDYREENKEAIKERKKKEYEARKARLLEKYTCVCGKELSLCGKARHEKTKAHLDWSVRAKAGYPVLEPAHEI